MTPRFRDLGLFQWLRWIIFGPPKCETLFNNGSYLCGHMSEVDCRGGYCDAHCQCRCSDGCRRALNRRLGNEVLAKAISHHQGSVRQ